MVSANEIFNIFFTFSKGKFVLFLIIFLFLLSFLLIIPIKKREKDPKTKKYVIVYKLHPVTKRKIPVTKSYPIWGIVTIIFALSVFAYNYLTPQAPSYDYVPEIFMGNTSVNISETNIGRLNYLSDYFVIVKLSTQDTPSSWSIDDLDVDNNREYWKTHEVRPIWDCDIVTYGSWTLIHVELYYPRNGANPIGEKHSHDFEEINFYYNGNGTVPNYVSFPLFKGFTEHPHELLNWYDMPQYEDKFLLRLDSSTNAFHENYDVFPEPNRNYRPTFISADFRDWSEYLSTIEKTIVYSSALAVFITITYMAIANKYRHKYYLLCFILSLMALYPLITLQYDFVQGASFNVYIEGEKPDTSVWFDSNEGRDYINGYGGLPYDRNRWTEPRFANELGIPYDE